MLGLWLLGWGAFWIWHHRWITVEWIGVLFWRGTALLGVVYLVYDRIYEAGATISSVASDPKNPLYFPFAISNNSHIFTLPHVKWTCRIVSGNIGGINFDNVAAGFGGSVSEIAPGDALNVTCRNMIKGATLERPSVYIEVNYDTSILGYTFTRAPKMFFTWAADASNPQWIRGEFAK
jgi:hypothetical protein